MLLRYVIRLIGLATTPERHPLGRRHPGGHELSSID